jgi:hypothetical protein
MEFTANEYYIHFLLEGLPFLLAPIIYLSIWIRKQDFSILKNKVKLVLLLIPVLFLVVIGSRICKIDLVIDLISNKEVYDTGVIESIERDTLGLKTNHSYTGDEFSDVIVIEGEKYYIITSGDLEVGDIVHFTYLQYSKTILKIQVND